MHSLVVHSRYIPRASHIVVRKMVGVRFEPQDEQHTSSVLEIGRRWGEEVYVV